MARRDAVIFDMDGTLADTGDLQRAIDAGDPDYDAYHEKARNAEPLLWTVDAARRWESAEFDVLIVTARSEKYRDVTRDWLYRNRVRYSELLMRDFGDTRPDAEVKQDILRDVQTLYKVWRAYDDNASVAAMFEANGIPTVVLPGSEGETCGAPS